MADSQSNHRQQLERSVVAGGIAAEKRGQLYGFILGLLADRRCAMKDRITLAEPVQTPRDEAPHWPGLELESLIRRLRIFEAQAQIDGLRALADGALVDVWMGPRTGHGGERSRGL